MLESKLWHSKTETKIVKCVKIVGVIKICDQYRHKFKFGHMFNFCWGEEIFKKQSL